MNKKLENIINTWELKIDGEWSCVKQGTMDSLNCYMNGYYCYVNCYMNGYYCYVDDVGLIRKIINNCCYIDYYDSFYSYVRITDGILHWHGFSPMKEQDTNFILNRYFWESCCLL